MNFYQNKLQAKIYKKILKNYKKDLTKEFVLKNWGSLSGDKSFYRTLKLFQLISGVKKIKGDIVEFGIWNGNNLFVIKKIIDFLKLNKTLYGYDHFEGLKNPNKNDKYLICKLLCIVYLIKLSFYYFFPKSPLMLYSLTTKQQTDAWADIYTEMKNRWITSLTVGFFGYVLLSYSLCVLCM